MQEIEKHVDRKEYQIALTKLNRISEKKRNYLYYRLRGYCNVNNRTFNEAIEDFNQALKLKADDTISYYYKGIAFDSLLVFDSALVNYKKALALNNYSRPEIYHNIGSVYERMGNLEMALFNYKKSMMADSNFYPGFNNAGLIYDELKKYDSAIYCYSKGISLAGMESYLYYNRAMSLHNLGNIQKCISDLDSAILIDDHPLYIINRGVVFLEIKQFDKACEDFKTAYSMGLTEAAEYLNEYCQ